MKRIVLLLAFVVFGVGAFGQIFDPNPKDNLIPRDKKLEARIDSLPGPVFNVKTMFGAVGDGVTDDTEAIRAALSAGADQTVVFPIGEYAVYDTILISDATKLVGFSSDITSGNRSCIIGKVNKPILHFYADDGGGGYGSEYGPSITNMTILGLGKTSDSTEQHGIVFNGSLRAKVENVYVLGAGGYGYYFGSIFHTDLVRVNRSTAQSCGLGGAFGMGYSTKQVNAVSFNECTLSQNGGYGAWLTGTNLAIRDSDLQGNDSASIYISYLGLASNATCQGFIITGNYIEGNGGASIFQEAGYTGGYAHVIRGVWVYNNYFNENNTTTVSPKSTAIINFNNEPGSSAVNYFDDCFVGPNIYDHVGIYCVDGNNVLDYNTMIQMYYYHDRHSEFVNLGTASVIDHGEGSSGVLITTNLAAGTGITDNMLSGFMIFTLSGNIDITANPQIEAGFDGQKIRIINRDATDTLTLDDGNGLSLSGQFVMGQNDVIELIYYKAGATWIEVSRSDN